MGIRESDIIQESNQWRPVIDYFDKFHSFTDDHECIVECFERYDCSIDYGLDHCKIDYCFTECPDFVELCTVEWFEPMRNKIQSW